jgi:inhibitor of cysteine peptidase
MTKFKYLLMMLALMLGVAYAATQTSNVVFSDSKNPIVVQAASPDFVITLPSNRTTGYSWFLKQHDAHLIKMVSHKYIRPQQQMPGAGGYEIWTFKAKPEFFKGSATSDITLVYARPWQRTSVKTETFKVTAKQ